jgi:hypothetical protein
MLIWNEGYLLVSVLATMLCYLVTNTKWNHYKHFSNIDSVGVGRKTSLEKYGKNRVLQQPLINFLQLMQCFLDDHRHNKCTGTVRPQLQITFLQNSKLIFATTNASHCCCCRHSSQMEAVVTVLQHSAHDLPLWQPSSYSYQCH